LQREGGINFVDGAAIGSEVGGSAVIQSRLEKQAAAKGNAQCEEKGCETEI